MAGHLGVETVTVQNLQVVSVDDAKGLIVLKGAVPGHADGYVYVYDAVKRGVPAQAPYPAGVRKSDAPQNDNPAGDAAAA